MFSILYNNTQRAREYITSLIVTDLEKQLQDSQDCRIRMIATDGVFSMDGNVTPLKLVLKPARTAIVQWERF